MTQASAPRIQGLRVRPVRVPMTHPHQTASGTIAESPLVLTDALIDDGTVGHSMVFTYTAAALKPTAELIRNFEALVTGEPLAPAEIAQKLATRFRLLGTQGLVGMALAAIDMALWDALARSHATRLVRLLGGIEKPIPAYGAIGYDGADASARTGEDWAKRGFTGVKAKIGYPTVQEDVAVIRAIRSAVGDNVAVMVDYNQCLTPSEAIQRLRVLDDEGLTWVEEPTLAPDYAGHADPVRGKLVGRARHPACHRRAGFRLRDARCHENRRRDRLDARGDIGACPGHPRIQPPMARNQRAAIVRDAGGSLA